MELSCTLGKGGRGAALPPCPCTRQQRQWWRHAASREVGPSERQALPLLTRPRSSCTLGRREGKGPPSLHASALAPSPR